MNNEITDVLYNVSIPAEDATLLRALSRKLGWKVRKRRVLRKVAEAEALESAAAAEVGSLDDYHEQFGTDGSRRDA